jgi:DNA-binding CsgD family transcriptional regulator
VRFRHYDPTPGMCRWLERDPAGYQDGPSLYSYLGRNPMAGTDPYGLFASSISRPEASLTVVVAELSAQGMSSVQILQHLIARGISSVLIADVLGYDESYVDNFRKNWRKLQEKDAKPPEGAKPEPKAPAQEVPIDYPKPGKDFDFDDPDKTPEGYRERRTPDGNYWNPKTRESLRPDLDHPPPIGPHWDWRRRPDNWWRIFRDGSIEPHLILPRIEPSEVKETRRKCA